MAKVFISYRREDSQWPADRLYEALKAIVPNPEQDIFIDVDNIPLGVDFREHLDNRVAQCEVLLALIGRSWLEARNPETHARRLDDPDDFVRLEIASALKRGIPVVPVLIDGTGVPKPDDLPEDLKPLSYRNGVELKRLNFDSDVERLIGGLGLVPPVTSPTPPPTPGTPTANGHAPGKTTAVLAITAGVLAMVILAFGILTYGVTFSLTALAQAATFIGMALQSQSSYHRWSLSAATIGIVFGVILGYGYTSIEFIIHDRIREIFGRDPGSTLLLAAPPVALFGAHVGASLLRRLAPARPISNNGERKGAPGKAIRGLAITVSMFAVLIFFFGDAAPLDPSLTFNIATPFAVVGMALLSQSSHRRWSFLAATIGIACGLIVYYGFRQIAVQVQFGLQTFIGLEHLAPLVALLGAHVGATLPGLSKSRA